MEAKTSTSTHSTTSSVRKGGGGRGAGGGRGNYSTDFADTGQEWRRLLAELLGTFLLTLVAAGGPVIAAATHQRLGHASEVVAPALMVMAIIYALGDVSGAHLNPAVTLTFTLRRVFPWGRVPGYWAVQVAGAVLAALLLRVLFGNVGHLGATLPHHGHGTSLVMEIVLTGVLVTIILGTADAHRIVGHNAALAVAGTIALLGLFASPVSGASMNPARSLGPDLIAGTMGSYWIYLVGPACGALLAIGFAIAFHGSGSQAERDAAVGSVLTAQPQAARTKR